MKKLSYQALIQYFDLDRNNCLLTREDFCKIITDFINNPERTRKAYLDGLKGWINERAEMGWHINEPIETHDEVFEFWKEMKDE